MIGIGSNSWVWTLPRAFWDSGKKLCWSCLSLLYSVIWVWCLRHSDLEYWESMMVFSFFHTKFPPRTFPPSLSLGLTISLVSGMKHVILLSPHLSLPPISHALRFLKAFSKVLYTVRTEVTAASDHGSGIYLGLRNITGIRSFKAKVCFSWWKITSQFSVHGSYFPLRSKLWSEEDAGIGVELRRRSWPWFVQNGWTLTCLFAFGLLTEITVCK